MVRINGAENHSFLNPAGVRCNFTTFANCENVLVHDRLHTEHSWFPGYGWRFLLCSACSQHLGWKYDAVRPATRPRAFFGVLFDAVRVDPDQE
jgi:cereblon